MSAALDLAAPEPPLSMSEPKSAGQFVTFGASGRAYGVDIMSVREIRSWTPTTELPDGTPGARGVLDIRGSVVEVYDLSVLMGGQTTEARPGHVVLILSLGERNVGVLVDSVSDIIFAEANDLLKVPSAKENSKVSSLVRQQERLIAILNPASLLTSPANDVWIVD